MKQLLDFTPSSQQTEILKGKVCAYCKRKTELVSSTEKYQINFGLMYICWHCDAYVGCHKNTDIALGRVANKRLRAIKKTTHFHFDKLWKSKLMDRHTAYQRLSGHLGIPKEYTHIGMFKLETCNEVIKWSQKEYKEQLLNLKVLKAISLANKKWYFKPYPKLRKSFLSTLT